MFLHGLNRRVLNFLEIRVVNTLAELQRGLAESTSSSLECAETEGFGFSFTLFLLDLRFGYGGHRRLRLQFHAA